MKLSGSEDPFKRNMVEHFCIVLIRHTACVGLPQYESEVQTTRLLEYLTDAHVEAHCQMSMTQVDPLNFTCKFHSPGKYR